MTLRAFIAIPPPLTLQHTVTEIRQVFQPLHLPWRWVRPEQLHLTLRFLGNIPAAQVSTIAQAMEHAAHGQPAFMLQARALGCFPHPSRPRVLWIGLDDPGQTLVPFNERLTAALLPLGFPLEDQPFHPHLTLARAQNRMPPGSLLPILHTYQNRHFGEFPVTQLHLLQSQLQRGGSLYTRLYSVALQS